MRTANIEIEVGIFSGKVAPTTPEDEIEQINRMLGIIANRGDVVLLMQIAASASKRAETVLNDKLNEKLEG